MKKEYIELAKAARNAKLKAYSPFSKFNVGAALLTTNGKIFDGCNIENSSYSLTICAERVAIFKAISEGYREFRALAVVSDNPGFTPPCGACRQVFSELASNIDFIMMNTKGQFKIKKITQLLPFAFTGNDLKRSF